MRITLARLYAKTRRDGATVLSGSMGYGGMLRVLPNPDFNSDDPKSAPFLAVLEEKPDGGGMYQGPQLMPPPKATPRAFTEGEIVE